MGASWRSPTIPSASDEGGYAACVADRTRRATARQRSRSSRYERARDVGREALRDAVLQTAGDLLALEGPGALTMRKIADHLGASTTVLYTVFDGKNGIIDAMVHQGHELLRDGVESIPEEDEP